MSFLNPYVDVSYIPQGAFCYSFYDNYLVVFNDDSTHQIFVLQNNKFYPTNVDSVLIYSHDTCISYDDVRTIEHSMAGLAPFYCFLCVVIFSILLYVPYKIFIRPFFHKL